ncbi:MAG: ComF family protein [Armatimonadetes bacterium]|nr:ComF family protein [Armatimonadota bacterium]
MLPPRLTKAWTEIVDLVYPPRCEVCGQDSPEPLCDDCVAAIEYVAPPYCARCNVPFPPDQEDRGLCPSCRQSRSPLVAVRSVGLHVGPLRQAVLRLKFQSAKRLAPVLARLMYDRVLEEADRPGGLAVGEIEALVPAVLHQRRRRWRGFDQAFLLAQELGDLWRIEVIEAVERTKFTRPQVELEPHQRRRNLQGAFKPVAGADLAGRTIAVVDDVFTTGATLEACARAARRAGAGIVYGLTVTRAVPSWHPAAAERFVAAGA